MEKKLKKKSSNKLSLQQIRANFFFKTIFLENFEN
jgi:hypothetical protein